MTKPLALVLYEQLLPGTQLLNRLQDLGYRVQSTGNPHTIAQLAQAEKPLFILADLRFSRANICNTLQELRNNDETRHIAIIAFADPADLTSHAAALKAGATVVAGSDGIMDQLEALLDQALHVE